MTAPRFESLFQPIGIGSMKLKNRIVMPPMGTNFGDPDHPGFVSERHKSYYQERARGGAGLIFLEGANVNPFQPMRKCGLAIYSDQFISGLRELVDLVKIGGARCGMQLAIAGKRRGTVKVDSDEDHRKPALKLDTSAPAQFSHPSSGSGPGEYSQEELEKIVEYFAEAAKRAKKIEVDTVMIQGAHGNPLTVFLSPRTNKRTDQYGGNIEGRSRFPLRVVEAVKGEIGSNMVLSYRLSVLEFIEGGLDIGDSIFFAKKLEEAGVQLINVSGGVNEGPLAMNQVIPPMSFARGRLVPYSKQIRNEVKVPVSVVQRINTPELADEIIHERKADLVETGRALVADPHWPLKAQEGRLDEIRRCVACNQGCMENVQMDRGMSCLYNPEVGYENIYPIGKKATKSKRVLIVGGGLAGMEAAYISAMRGHQVSLVEKGPKLGGSASVASVVEAKKEFAGVTEFLEKQVRKWNVDVRLNEEVNSDVLKAGDVDEIIMATGSVPNVPRINVSNSACEVRFAKDVLKDATGVGEEVIILGGGSIGMETAEYLDRLGKKVTVIEMLDRVCSDLGPLNRADVLDRIEKTSIKIMVKTRMLELTEKGIRVSKEGKEETITCPDTVVIAIGAKPHTIRIEGAKANVHYVGDCQKVGNAMDAIHDAFHVALKL